MFYQKPKKAKPVNGCAGCSHAMKTSNGGVWCWKFAVKLKLTSVAENLAHMIPRMIHPYRDCEGSDVG